jgi:hypothetical protein
MVFWPREMVYSIVDLRAWVPCAFGAKFKNGPILVVLVVEMFDESIGWIAIGFLWLNRARPRGYNEVCNIA